MRRLVRVYGFVQTFSMHHKYTDTNATFMQPRPAHPPSPSEGQRAGGGSGPLPLLTRLQSCRDSARPASTEGKQTLVGLPRPWLPASQRPPGGCPAAPAPRTRMFGLENDFPTPSAPFSNCWGVITLSPSHLWKPKSCGVFLSGFFFSFFKKSTGVIFAP